MLAKTPKSDGPLDLDAVRRELADAQAKLNAILARELASTDTAAAFNAWRAERDAAIAEVERLSKLIERLDSAANVDAIREQQAALQKRVDVQRKSNDVLARRIREEGRPAIEKLLELVRDVAAAAIVDAELNAKLPDDAERIQSADMLARYRPPAPREDISEKEIELWVFASNGNLVGAQDDVIGLSDGSGYLLGSQHRTHCVRRKYRSIEYREAEARQPFNSLYEALRLPNVDGPGTAWRPRERMSPSAALEVLKRRSSNGTKRQIFTELTPVEAWGSTPVFDGGHWSRAGDI